MGKQYREDGYEVVIAFVIHKFFCQRYFLLRNTFVKLCMAIKGLSYVQSLMKTLRRRARSN